MAKCTHHQFDDAVGACVDCGRDLCERCLVPPEDPRQPARCVPCSLARVGIGLRHRPTRGRRGLFARRS